MLASVAVLHRLSAGSCSLPNLCWAAPSGWPWLQQPAAVSRAASEEPEPSPSFCSVNPPRRECKKWCQECAAQSCLSCPKQKPPVTCREDMVSVTSVRCCPVSQEMSLGWICCLVTRSMPGTAKAPRLKAGLAPTRPSLDHPTCCRGCTVDQSQRVLVSLCLHG